ncbi:MAG: hypothetical protein KJO07_09375 [Deltaproteobacteria bacterium]|nr:hypothetical protein [Deltaproteobacteria bacterium]
MRSLLAATLALALVPSIASGKTAVSKPEVTETSSGSEPVPDKLVSISIPALTVRSLSVSYEHHSLGDLLDDRFSVMVHAGIRDTAQEDFAGTTVASGFGVRYWLTGRAPWSRYQEPGMLGLFTGLRVGLAYANIRDEIDDERIGATLTLSETVELGYRFAAWGRMEITPSTGFQLRHDFDLIGDLPAWTKGAFIVGLSVGYLF